MFTSLHLENFKSWQDTGQLELAPLTGFFGTNSSGKSSLIQSLLLMKQTVESNNFGVALQTGSSAQREQVYVNLGTLADLIHGEAQTLGLGFSWRLPKALAVTFRTKQTEHTLALEELAFQTHITSAQKQIIVQDFSYAGAGLLAGMRHQNAGNYAVDFKLNEESAVKPQARPQEKVARPNKCYGFSPSALKVYQDREALSALVFALEQKFRDVYYLGPLRDYPQRSYLWSGDAPLGVGLKGEFTLEALLSGKETRVYRGRGAQPPLEKRVGAWLKELGLAHGFRTQDLPESNLYEIRIRRTADSREVLLPDLGFGLSQVLPVLVLCYYVPFGSTLILEQPEIHLHPSVQAGLADVFIDVIQKRGLQIILESHSEHLLRRLQRRIAEEAFPHDKAALYFAHMEGQASRLDRLALDLFGQISNWPQDFFGDLLGESVATLDSALRRQMGA